MNKKGFALTETLVVIVFLVTIFTFIYVSILPLMGKYESAIASEEDIDIVYKLYHIRKMIMSDNNRKEVIKNASTNDEVAEITCSSLNRTEFCENMISQMELTNNYTLIYAKSINETNLGYISNISPNGPEIASYAKKHQREINNRVLFLLDTKNHTIGFLYYDDRL